MATKSELYDLLELWAKWWNGPGRENYNHPVRPPITKTGKLLSCTLCSGCLPEGETCEACGRTEPFTPLGG